MRVDLEKYRHNQAQGAILEVLIFFFWTGSILRSRFSITTFLWYWWWFFVGWFLSMKKRPLRTMILKKCPLWYLQNSLPRSSKSTILILIKSPLIFWKNPTEILKKYPQIRSQNPYFNIEPHYLYSGSRFRLFTYSFSKNPFKTYISLQYYSNSL